MTYREHVMSTDPFRVHPDCMGGVKGCPGNIGDFSGIQEVIVFGDGCYRKTHDMPNSEACTRCWDQEIPGTEPKQPTRKKVVYISGPITGVDEYWLAFEYAEEELQSAGFTPLSPAHLPEGMSKEQYMRINFASIDAADAVLFLDGWHGSEGANLEKAYCDYIGKPKAWSVGGVKEVLSDE